MYRWATDRVRDCPVGAMAVAMSLGAVGPAQGQGCESGQWISRFPQAREFGSLAFDSARGRAVLFGGVYNDEASNSHYLGDTSFWAGLSWQVTRPTAGPSPRMGQAMAYDAARDRVVLFGGTGTSVPETWEWDGTTWTLRSTSGPSNRIYAAMTYDPIRHLALMVGGRCLGSCAPYQDGVWQWNGVAWTQPPQTVVPAGRSSAGAAYDTARGRLVVFGGQGVSGSLGDTWEWDNASWSLRAGTGPSPRFDFGMVFDAGRSRTVLFGGPDANVWEWDGAAWAARAAIGPARRFGPSMAYDNLRQRVVVFGGAVPNSGQPFTFYSAETWEWDGSAWTGPGAMPVRRRLAAATFDASRGGVVVFGGELPLSPFNGSDTWVWDGARWSSVGGNAPPGRDSAALAYDSVRARTVLFGGKVGGSTVFGDTWELGASGWVQASVIGPHTRYAHALAFDQARHRVVLFGGTTNIGPPWILSDTWEWDGTSWVERLVGGPPPRYWHGLAFDSDRNVSVLFGGGTIVGPNLVPYSDTWEWDGAAWALRSSSGPPARYGHVMAYDTARHKVILQGGQADSAAALTDTWEWDGSTWSQRPETNPLARTYAAAAYDPNRRRLVRFGGEEIVNFHRTTYGDLDEFASSSAPSISRPPTPVRGCDGTPAGFSVLATGVDPLSFQWRRDGVPLVNGGRLSGTTTAQLQITPAVTADAGAYDVVVTNSCGAFNAAPASLTFPCYPNCDCSRTVPIMNVLDFVCFLNRYAAADPYANCDGSTTAPVVNVLDFSCFLNAFASGCP